MTNTTVPFMRPLTLGEILDQAFRLYRRNFSAFIGILAIPYIPLMLIQGGLSYISMSSLSNPSDLGGSPFYFPANYWLGLLGMIVVGFFSLLLVSGLANASLTRAVADDYIGRRAEIFGSYKKIGSSWLNLAGALILYFFLAVASVIWTLVPLIGWLTGPGIYMALALVFVPLLAPVVVLERQDILSSMRRAWDLSRTRFWWLIGFALILFLLGRIVILGPTYLITFILQLIFANQGNLEAMLIWRPVIQVLSQMLAGLLFLPLQMAAMTVVYFDLRVRSEGLDLALQAAANSGAETNIIALAETSPQTTGSVITGQDVLHFFLLSLGVVAIFAILIGLYLALILAFVSSMNF